MFTHTAGIYDAVYRAIGKDYAAEAEDLHVLIEREKRTDGNALLDVAAGTGAHAERLATWYAVEGIDLDAEMVRLAEERVPEARFHLADMTEFDLGRRFDAVVCLFSSIGYAKTVANMERAVSAMAGHLKPGGVLVIEPWLAPDAFADGHLGAVFVDEPELKVARMSLSERRGNVSIVEFEYLVGSPDGVVRLTERHELGLFTREEQMAALERAGLDAHWTDGGPMDRGLFWARRGE